MVLVRVKLKMREKDEQSTIKIQSIGMNGRRGICKRQTPFHAGIKNTMKYFIHTRFITLMLFLFLCRASNKLQKHRLYSLKFRLFFLILYWLFDMREEKCFDGCLQGCMWDKRDIGRGSH